MGKKHIELGVLVAIVALGFLFLSDRMATELEPSGLRVNHVSIGQTRLQIEDILGEPTWEKRTDLAAYGWQYGVSVEYDGSERNSIATSIHGSELTFDGRVVLTEGCSLELARSLLGEALAATPEKKHYNYYPVAQSAISLVTLSDSSKVRAFQAGVRENVENPVPYRSPIPGDQ